MQTTKRAAIFWGMGFLFLASMASAHPSRPFESCEYFGNVDSYGGQLHIRTIAERGHRNLLKLRVIAKASASWLWIPIGHMIDEITEWEGNQLKSIFVNLRDLRHHNLRYQKWDRFVLGPNGFEAHRAQAKDLETIRQKHARMEPFWNSPFGGRWVDTYPLGGPERRQDLDYSERPMPPGLVTPLAQTFYFIRFLRPGTWSVPVFVPGEKRQKKFDLVTRGTALQGGGVQWQTRIDIGELHTDPANPAQAFINQNGYIQSMQVSLVHSFASASGELKFQGCSNVRN